MRVLVLPGSVRPTTGPVRSHQPGVYATTNSDFRSALTSGFHTESSKSRSRLPSLDTLLLLLVRLDLRFGSQWYGARASRRAFRRSLFCCISSCRRSTLQRVARFSVCRRRSPLGLHILIWLWHWTTECRGCEAAADADVSFSEVVLLAGSGEGGGEAGAHCV